MASRQIGRKLVIKTESNSAFDESKMLRSDGGHPPDLFLGYSAWSNNLPGGLILKKNGTVDRIRITDHGKPNISNIFFCYGLNIRWFDLANMI